ncbi:MAG: anthranilate synthase component I family protein [Acidobacteria bacterium]|nr:MAG: anthranilate synthase component I family protein [Acidobacteriota bacterium]
MTEVSAELLGHGWGPWRGSWRSDRILENRTGQWVLERGGSAIDQWPDLRQALSALWPLRNADDDSPWMVGWIGYEEAASLAGDLPTRGGEDSAPAGRFLLEPTPASNVEEEDHPAAETADVARWSLDGGRYRDSVESIRQRIASGDVYQVNLCRRMTVEGRTGHLGSFAKAASKGGEPDYLARFHFGDDELLCASMEMLLRKRGNVLETCPIKGTRPRGKTPKEDRRLVEELASDPKERAELAMVVDLERNDLGRVSRIGSVEVVDPGSVRTYATIHHLVGRVRGEARPDLEWWELLAAMVPGGSVTGCPKYAAMSLIRDLEPVRRGPFTGAIGVVASDGDMEFALPIRTAWRVGTTVEFAAGCGVVWDSNPEAEERECRLKVERWLDLVGCAV